jgi:hypothetical protein
MLSQTHIMKKTFDVRGARLCAGLWSLLLLILITASQWPALAQTAPAPVPQSSNRYLFIVETSKAMQRRTNAVLTVINNLMATGMKGQLQTGDTIGIWTFNQEVHDGRFPLQEWSPKAARMVASAMLMFLESEKWEKPAKLDPVVSAMKDLVKDSDNLMVVLISSGEENVIGTPFDAVINESFNSWKADQKKQQMPFVTVFRGVNGQLVKAAVTPVPWEIEIPRVTPTNAPSTIVAKARTNAPVSAPPPAPVPALIVTGKKPPPLPTPNNAVAEPATNQVDPQTTAIPPTNPVPKVTLSGGHNIDGNNKHAFITVRPSSPSTGSAIEPTNTTSLALASPQTSSNATTAAASARLTARTSSLTRAEETNQMKSGQPASAHTTVASTAPGILHNKKLWIAFAGMILLLAILFIFSRRSTPEDRISLITKSIDLKKK